MFDSAWAQLTQQSIYVYSACSMSTCDQRPGFPICKMGLKPFSEHYMVSSESLLQNEEIFIATNMDTQPAEKTEEN